MDSLYQKSTLDISKITERCVAGYETYRPNDLSIGDTTSFGVKGMGDHSSDADDEITDVSGENHSCSPEICDSSKQYYVLSGTKPFSIVIRRCSTPTTESNSFLKRDSSVSPFTIEFEKNSKSEILNSNRKVNGSFVHQRAIVSCNPVSSDLEESGDISGHTLSGGTVRNLQEVSLNTPKESNDSVVTQEFTENVKCGNALHIGVTTIPSAENHVQFNYTDGSALLPSQHTFKNCCSDSTDGNCFLPLCCSMEKHGRLKDDSTDNRNQYSSLLLGNPKNTQSLMCMLPSGHSKQEVEHSIHNSVLKGQEEDSNVGITRGGKCQAMEAADNIKHEAKISADVIFDTDSFHMREHSESAEQMAVHNNIRSEFVTAGEHNLKSSIIEASLNKVCEGDEIAIVDDSLTFENSELTLLGIQGGNVSELGNQNEGCNEVKADVSRDVVVTVDRNTFDEEDHIFSGGKQDEWKNTEVTLDVRKTAVQNYTVKSETENEISCEPALTPESYYTSEDIKISVLQNCSVVNTMRNASETISSTPIGHQESASGVGNSESSIPVIHTENRQTLSVEDDNFVQKHVEYSCGGENEGSETESSLCLTLSPRDLVPPVDVDGVLIADVIAKDVPVSVKAEVIKNSVCSSALEDKLAESVTMGGLDGHVDKFCTTSKADNLQSQGSVLVQPCTEDALDSDIPSDTVHIELSPLLFSSEDDNSYYTETVTCEQEVTATKTYYDEALITEQKKLHRLQEALLGVPPPPSVTIPQHNVADILRLWKENRSLISAYSETKAVAGAVKSEAAILKRSHLEQMKNSSWPESKYFCCYGIQYNRGQISEEFEILCQRLQERCVGSETTSSCNIWFNLDISNKVHHVNSRRRSTGHSPGSRLSHLARRRRTFSSADLCNSSVAGQLPGKHHSSAIERRLIMVDLKKTEHRQRPRSFQPHKQVPSVDRNQLQQTKRALFKSPPNNHKRIFSASKSKSGSKRAKSDIDRTRIENSKRALWPCTSKNNVVGKTEYDRMQTSLSGEISGFGKRKREEQGMLTPHNTCARKMLFGDAAAVKGKGDLITAGDNIQRLRTGENKPQMSVSRDMTGGLSEVQRKKLLWAVAEALRAEGISMSHPLFRPYATSLARLVRNVMPDLNCRRTFSTSDLMLQLAKQYIGDVMKEDQNGQTTINSRT